MHIPLNKNKKYWLPAMALLLTLIVTAGFFSASPASRAATDDPDVLNEQLEQKKQEIEDLKRKAELYEQNAKVKQQEAITLKNQISLIDTQVSQTENDITRIQTEMEALALELERLNNEITIKTGELDKYKDVLASYLRLINRYDQQSHLKVMLTQGTFSDFFDNMQYAETLQQKIEEMLSKTKEVRDSLTVDKTSKETKRTELKDLSDKLVRSKMDLTNQQQYKEVLLVDTKESEEAFNELLQQAKKEQEAAQSEIYSLESKIRKQLKDEGVTYEVVDAALTWPVPPKRGISAYFHDPSYPYRRYFEHSAIDIPAPQGSPMRAAEAGYIARAKNAGMGYSYIMIVHNDTISTVYGHVTRIDVAEEQYVARGQQIGLVGGLPGTPGAGGLTTGPHLHFEVRYNGIPVNPLDYLPAL